MGMRFWKSILLSLLRVPIMRMSWATSRYQQSTVFLSERRFKLQDCLRLCCAGSAKYSQRGSGIFARIGAAKAAWEAANESREVRVPLTQVAGGRDER